ncbi:integrase, catalytic region, zinc finger, CCHC-type containing protein [Tanacetum coccineum]
MGENVYIWDLIDLDVTMSTSRGKFVSPKMFSMVYEVLSNVGEETVADFCMYPERIFTTPEQEAPRRCWLKGKPIQKLRQKGVYETLPFMTCCINWGKEVNTSSGGFWVSYEAVECIEALNSSLQYFMEAVECPHFVNAVPAGVCMSALWTLSLNMFKPRSSMFKRRLIAADQASVFMAMMSDHNSSDLAPQRQEIKDKLSQQGLEFLFSPLLEDYYNPTHGLAEENNNDQAPNASFQEAEFINPFCTRVQEIGESSSRNIDNTNVHSFQPQSHDYRWTRDHPLEQVRGNPTMPVQTRRQLATDLEMCMFALTVSIVEPKNIKEAMADSAWIEAMQDELHQFDRLKVWELVDKPFGKMIIKLKWLWKNKKDEDQTDGRENSILKGPLKERFMLHSQKGFVEPDHPEKVYLLQETLSFWRDTVLGDKLVSWMSKKQKLHCNVSERGRVRGCYLQVVLSNVDEDTNLQRLWSHTTTNYRLYATLSQAIAISCNRPPQSEPHETIVIAHVYGNHYIKAALREGFPLPMTNPLWRTYRSDIASRCEDPYVSRQEEFREHYYRIPENFDLSK